MVSNPDSGTMDLIPAPDHLSLSCSMGSMPIGVHDIFHEMAPISSVHRQSIQGADVLVAPVQIITEI